LHDQCHPNIVDAARAGRALAQLGGQPILHRPAQGRTWLGRRIGCSRARGLASKSFHPRSRLRPFVHPDRCDQRLAAEPGEHARARRRRPRSLARGSAISAGLSKRLGSRSPIKATSTPRRSPARSRPARMARESVLAASRPRRSACGWFSRTGRSWTSTPTRIPKRWRLRRFPSACSA